MVQKKSKSKGSVSSIPNPHDLAFKSALSDVRVAREFFETHLPKDILPLINLSVLQLQNASFIDPELTTGASDLLYRTEFFSNKKEKTTGYVYLLTEQQTQPDFWMPLRILRYLGRILDQHRRQYPNIKKLPLIVPLIFYTGQTEYCYSTDLFQLFGEQADLAKRLLFGPYPLAQLHHLDDPTILQHHWSGLLEILMKHIRTRNTALLLKDARHFFEALLDQEDMEEYIMGMLNYILTVGDSQSLEDFMRIVRTEFPKRVEDKLMNIAEEFKRNGIQEGFQAGVQLGRQTGRQEGRQEGKQEGKQEGRQETFQQLKTARQLLQSGMALNEIAEATGIPLGELQELLG